MDHFRGFYASRCSLLAPSLSISRVFGGYLSTTDTHLAGKCRPPTLTPSLIVGYRHLGPRLDEQRQFLHSPVSNSRTAAA